MVGLWKNGALFDFYLETAYWYVGVPPASRIISWTGKWCTTRHVGVKSLPKVSGLEGNVFSLDFFLRYLPISQICPFLFINNH